MSQAGKFFDSTALADIETLTGNSGGAVGADAAFNINIVGTSTNGINVVGNPGTNTLTVGMNSPYADGSFTFSGGSLINSGDSRLGLQATGTRTVTDNSNMAAFYVNATFSPTSSTTNCVSAYLEPYASPGSGVTITNFLGLYVTGGSQSGAGSVTNCYGLYIAPLNVGTNKYGAYIANNVGIGTSAPITLLHVKGSVSKGFSLENTSAGTGNYLEFKNQAGSSSFVGQDGFGLSNTEVGALFLGTWSSNSLLFFTNASEKMRLSSGGSLGIGTSSPSSKLDIQQSGTLKATTNFLELTNTANAVDMDGTATGLLFNQYYYDAATPAVVSAGRLSIAAKDDWTSTASTQNSYLSFELASSGTLREAFSFTHDGYFTFPYGDIRIKTTTGTLYLNPDNSQNVSIGAGGSGSLYINTSGGFYRSKTGTLKATTDFLEFNNTANAVDMDGTGTGILFKQNYYDAATPGLVDSGRIAVITETDWTSTAATQDSYMSFQLVNGGSLAEKVRITSDGYVGINNPNPTTSLVVSGGQIGNITTVTSATYDVLISDYILHVTYTATGPVTSLRLMTAQTVAGRIIHIKDAGGNAGTNNITITTEGSETIDGAATKVLNTNYQSVSLYSDGSNWFVY